MTIQIRKLEQLARDTRGAGFVEYIILIGLVALVGIGAYQAFGDAVEAKVKDQTNLVKTIK